MIRMLLVEYLPRIVNLGGALITPALRIDTAISRALLDIINVTGMLLVGCQPRSSLFKPVADRMSPNQRLERLDHEFEEYELTVR